MPSGEAWWRRRSRYPVPGTAEEAVAIAHVGGVAPARSITVRSVTGEAYDRVVAHDLDPIPPSPDDSHFDDGYQPLPVAEDDIPF